jgi:hypothetical protein
MDGCAGTWSFGWRRGPALGGGTCRNSVVVKPHVLPGLTRSLTPREPDAAAARAALRRHACRQAMARCAFESRGRGDVALAIRCCARRAGRRLRPGGEQPLFTVGTVPLRSHGWQVRSARHFGATCRPSCAHSDPLHTPSPVPHQRWCLHYPCDSHLLRRPLPRTSSTRT